MNITVEIETFQFIDKKIISAESFYIKNYGQGVNMIAISHKGSEIVFSKSQLENALKSLEYSNLDPEGLLNNHHKG